MEIRRAKQEDTKILDDFLTALIQDERQYDASICPDFAVEHFYEHVVNDATKCLLVALKEQEIVGYLYGYLIEKDATLLTNSILLDALYVVPHFRKQGIAKRLFHSFKEWAKEQNASQIEVHVWKQNKVAKLFYHLEGFEPVKETMICQIKEE